MELGGLKSFDSSFRSIQEVGGMKSMESASIKQFDDDKVDLVRGKVDWRGNPASKGLHGGISSAILPTATFGMENLASMSLAVNLITYLISIMHYDLSDASNTVTNFTGTGYILSVVIAIFADTFIQRYKVVCLATVIEFLGIGVLAIQAQYPSLRPPACNMYDPTSACVKVSGKNVTILFVALYLTAFGSAGVKAAVPPHCADQFDERNPREARQISSFFNWLLLSVCLSGTISLTFIVWIQDVKGFAWGFAICTAALVFALLIFASGIPRYRIPVIQQNNAFVEIFQVFVAAMRNRRLQLPDDPNELYEIEGTKEQPEEIEFLPHRNVFRSLDKAAIKPSSIPHVLSTSQWKLCRVTQVENTKIIVALIPVFCSTILMSTCLAQLQTFSIYQGTSMDTRIAGFNIPPASLPIFPIIFMAVLIPIYDRVIVPFARRITGLPTGITHFQRIGVGLVLACLSMSTAAIVEDKRKRVAASHGMLDAIPILQPLPISIFWLTFQYFIFGMADIFTYVGLMEFFYSEAPKALKAFATSFLWCSLSFGYFLSTILVKSVNAATSGSTSTGGWLSGDNLNRIHLDLFYWLLAGLCSFNFFVYLFLANWYEYRPQPGVDQQNV